MVLVVREKRCGRVEAFGNLGKNFAHIKYYRVAIQDCKSLDSQARSKRWSLARQLQ